MSSRICCLEFNQHIDVDAEHYSCGTYTEMGEEGKDVMERSTSVSIIVRQLASSLSQRYPLCYAEPWDPVGLCIGDENKQLNRIMSCVTVTPEVLAEALEYHVNLLLAHHPFPFQALSELNCRERKLYEELQAADVAVYSMHTAFDNAPGGINEQLMWLAVDGQGELPVDLQEYSKLQTHFLRTDKVIYTDQSPVVSSPLMVGSARLVRLSDPVTLAEVSQRMMQFLQLRPPHLGDDEVSLPHGAHYFRVVAAPSAATKLTRLVAACGVASSFVDECLHQRVELLICGELRYHECLKLKQGGCHVILLSHHRSEKFAMDYLAGWLSGVYAHQLEVFRSACDECPVETWYPS